MNVLDILQEANGDYVKRRDLAEKSGLCDRVMRQSIEDLRQAGYVIENAQDGRGYRLIENDVEAMKRQHKLTMARAKSLLRQAGLISKKIREVQ